MRLGEVEIPGRALHRLIPPVVVGGVGVGGALETRQVAVRVRGQDAGRGRRVAVDVEDRCQVVQVGRGDDHRTRDLGRQFQAVLAVVLHRVRPGAVDEFLVDQLVV